MSPASLAPASKPRRSTLRCERRDPVRQANTGSPLSGRGHLELEQQADELVGDRRRRTFEGGLVDESLVEESRAPS